MTINHDVIQKAMRVDPEEDRFRFDDEWNRLHSKCRYFPPVSEAILYWNEYCIWECYDPGNDKEYYLVQRTTSSNEY